MERRLFVKLLALPAVGLWPSPRAVLAQAMDSPVWSDDRGTPALSAIHDDNLMTGIEYQP